MSSVYAGEFRVSSAFGNRVLNGSAEYHAGIDLVGVSDKNIHAAVGGTVVASEMRLQGADPSRTWEWGNYVCVLGDDGNRYYYCHMSGRRVAQGQRVEAGDIVGTEGNTGYSYGSHCHFEVRDSAGKSINPAAVLGIPNAVGSYNGGEIVPAEERNAGERVTVSAPAAAPVQVQADAQPMRDAAAFGSHPARRSYYRVDFDGVNITEDLAPYLLSLTYTDNEDEEEDSLSIVLQDRDGIWLSSWLKDVIRSGAFQSGIRAWIYRENDNGRIDELYCGTFLLNSVDATDPSTEITLKAASLGYENGIRQTKQSHAWESGNLSVIVNEIAAKAGMEAVLQCEDAVIPDYVAQFEQSDMALLNDLCNQNGLILKVTDSQIVVYDQRLLEGRDAIGKIVRGDGTYLKANLTTGTANEKYRRCVVSYTTPRGELITGTAAEDDGGSDGKTLIITAYAPDQANAEKMAAAYLRRANLLEKCAHFTMYGNPYMVAGSVMELEGFGPWDGRHMITAATHKVDGSGGYTTALVTREVQP